MAATRQLQLQSCSGCLLDVRAFQTLAWGSNLRVRKEWNGQCWPLAAGFRTGSRFSEYPVTERIAFGAGSDSAFRCWISSAVTKKAAGPEHFRRESSADSTYSCGRKTGGVKALQDSETPSDAVVADSQQDTSAAPKKRKGTSGRKKKTAATASTKAPAMGEVDPEERAVATLLEKLDTVVSEISEERRETSEERRLMKEMQKLYQLYQAEVETSKQYMMELRKVETDYLKELRSVEADLRSVEADLRSVEADYLKELRSVEADLMRTRYSLNERNDEILALKGKRNLRGAVEFVCEKFKDSLVDSIREKLTTNKKLSPEELRWWNDTITRKVVGKQVILREIAKTDRFKNIKECIQDQFHIGDSTWQEYFERIYGSLSKDFHGIGSDVIISCEQFPVPAERTILVAILLFGPVRYKYVNDIGEVVMSPYDVCIPEEDRPVG